MKFLALSGMFAAHLCFVLGFPDLNFVIYFWVAPLFAALVGINTFSRSSDPKKYTNRLLFWALLSQPFHAAFFVDYMPVYYPNILFGLAAASYLVHRFRNVERDRLPSWAFYAAYPAHLLLLTIIQRAF